jgi:hypothetical protein
MHAFFYEHKHVLTEMPAKAAEKKAPAAKAAAAKPATKATAVHHCLQPSTHCNWKLMISTFVP